MLRFTLTINDPETLTAAPAIRADCLAALLREVAAEVQTTPPTDDVEAPIQLRHDTPAAGIWRLAHDDDAPAPAAPDVARDLAEALRRMMAQYPPVKITSRDGFSRNLAHAVAGTALTKYDAAIAAGQAPPAVAPAPDTVFVLFHETNTGHGEDSDGYIEDVYADRATADAACLARQRAARDAGVKVYTDPDDPDFDDPEWEHEWIVAEHQIRTTAPTHACTACGDTGTPDGPEGGDTSGHACGFCMRIGTSRPVDTSAPAVQS